MKENAQKYFFYHLKRLINNENKILIYKYQPSFREILLGYIENFKSTRNSETRKKSGSFKTYIKIILLSIENSSIGKSYLCDEFSILKEIVKESVIDTNNDLEKSYEELYKICQTYLKKLNTIDLYSLVIDKVLEENNFEQIENMAIELFNELTFDGYSLRYLKEYFQKIDVDSIGIKEAINKLRELKKENELFSFYISIYDKENFVTEEKLSYLKAIEESNKDFQEIQLKLNSKDNTIFLVEESGKDIYKVIASIVEKINNYFHLKKVIKNYKGILIKNEYYYTSSGNSSWDYMNNNDDNILFSKLNAREESDLKDFLEYRRNLNAFENFNEEIHILQRILNSTKSLDEISKESKLLNQWNSLEAILTYNKSSNYNKIVPKINSILPKIIILYFIKDRLNTVWHLLLSIRADYAKDMINDCKKENEKEYDLKKIIEYVKNMKKDKKTEIAKNQVLYREISIIAMLLNEKGSRKGYFEKIKEKIEQDISYIYRTRNLLVHSGMQPSTNFDFKTLRLSSYNNRILGVIIHYKKNNPQITIEEIFDSLEKTFDLYIKKIELDVELEYLCKPPYLFI